MRSIKEIDDNEVFYRGTIIVIKGAEITPKGIFDKRYCLVGNVGSRFEMLDLHRSMGSCIIHNLEPNVPGHFGVNKEGIREWVREYFDLFYTEEGKAEWIPQIDDIVFVENLQNYFQQSNRDIFV
jgi:hypothetical protein